MKKSFKLAIAAFASLLTLGGVSSTGFVAHAEETRVEVIAKGFQHDFWKAVNKGAEKAAQELGAKVTWRSAKTFQSLGLTLGFQGRQKGRLRQLLQLTTTQQVGMQLNTSSQC